MNNVKTGSNNAVTLHAIVPNLLISLRMHHFTVVLKHKGVDIPGLSLINNKLLSLKMHRNSRILKLELVIEIMNISDSCIKLEKIVMMKLLQLIKIFTLIGNVSPC